MHRLFTIATIYQDFVGSTQYLHSNTLNVGKMEAGGGLAYTGVCGVRSVSPDFRTSVITWGFHMPRLGDARRIMARRGPVAHDKQQPQQRCIFDARDMIFLSQRTPMACNGRSIHAATPA